MEVVFLTFILVLSVFLGFELISKVPATLHTPLMSGANAISGITLVGAFVSAGALVAGVGDVVVGDSVAEGGFAGLLHQNMSNILGTLAVTLATINVVGGYLVTDRMLSMFRSRKEANK